MVNVVGLCPVFSSITHNVVVAVVCSVFMHFAPVNVSTLTHTDHYAFRTNALPLICLWIELYKPYAACATLPTSPDGHFPHFQTLK